jgi:hypothetical protein
MTPTPIAVLRLPPPGARLTPCAGCPEDERLTRLLQEWSSGPRRDRAPAGSEPSDAVLRHRWWLGHQLSFLTWRALAEILGEMLGSTACGEEHFRRAAALYDAYSVLLIYSGGCSAQQYDAVLRPAMRAADPAFSGTWAADHAPLARLLDEVKARYPEAATGRLDRAVRTNRRVHVSVARRLVPGGGSLLSEAGPAAQEPAERQHALFDAFFRTERGAVCRSGLLTQYADRALDAVADLSGRGLFLDGVPLSAAARDSWKGELARLERGAPRILTDMTLELVGATRACTACVAG